MPVTIKVTVDDKKAAADIERFAKKAGADIKKLEKQSVKSGAKMKKAFQGASAALGPLGLAGGLTAVTLGIKSFFSKTAGFERTMAEVSTIVDTTTVNMKSLTDQVLELTKSVPQTADELGAGLYETISAGVTDTAEAMLFLETASKLAVAGLADTATTVDALTTIINAYGLETTEATRVSDLLFKTVESGKTKLPLLAGSIGNVASSAALAGVTIEELTASIAIMTKATGQTDETMTSLNRLFLSITNSTPAVQKAAKKLGIEWSANALRAKGFAKFMDELTTALQKDKNAIFDLGLDMRAFKALAVLGGASAKEFAKQIDIMNTAATGASEGGFKKMNETAGNQGQLLWNQISLIWQKTGQKVLPVVTGALKEVNRHLGAKGFLGTLVGLRNPMKSMVDLLNLEAEAAGKAAETQKELNAALATTPLAMPGGQKAVENAQKELKVVKETIVARTEGSGKIEAGLVKQNLLLAKYNTQTQTQILLSDPIVANIFQIADGLGQAVINAENLGDALNRILRQLASKALSALILGGVGRIFGGSFLGPIREMFGFQGGGSAIVPGSGSGDRPFMMNLEPGERVDVTPRNQVNNNQKITMENHFHFQIADELTIKTKVVPILNDWVQRQGGKLIASGVS